MIELNTRSATRAASKSTFAVQLLDPPAKAVRLSRSRSEIGVRSWVTTPSMRVDEQLNPEQTQFVIFMGPLILWFCFVRVLLGASPAHQ